jgi:hypothetical protein
MEPVGLGSREGVLRGGEAMVVVLDLRKSAGEEVY